MRRALSSMWSGSTPWRFRAQLWTRRVAAAPMLGKSPETLGNVHRIDDMLAKLACAAIVGAAGRFQPVPGNGRENRLYIVWKNTRMLADEGVRFCSGSERLCATG